MKNICPFVQLTLFCSALLLSNVSFGAAFTPQPAQQKQGPLHAEQRVQEALEKIQPNRIAQTMQNSEEQAACIQAILTNHSQITPRIMRKIADIYAGRTGITWEAGIGRWQGTSLVALRSAAEYFKNIPLNFHQMNPEIQMQLKDISNILALKFSEYAESIEKTIRKLSKKLNRKPLLKSHKNTHINAQLKDTPEANTLDLLLRKAVEKRNFKAIEQLLAAGADPCEPDRQERTAQSLMFTATKIPLDTKRAWMKKFLPFMRRNEMIPSILYHMFIEVGDAQAVALLIKKDYLFARRTIPLPEDLWNIFQTETLMPAIKFQQPIILAQFLDAGAQIDLNTAVDYALKIFNDSPTVEAETCIKILIALGAQPTNLTHIQIVKDLEQDPEVIEIATEVPKGFITKYLINKNQRNASLFGLLSAHLAQKPSQASSSSSSSSRQKPTEPEPDFNPFDMVD